MSQGGVAQLSYTYDAMGRRTSKAVQGGTPTQFLYDGANAVQETVGSTVNPILVGLGIDERFARNDTTGRTYFLTDALNSTIALTSKTGAIQNQYSYDPYGNTTQSGTGFTNPYQYTGREADTAGLYYYRARYYSPMMGSFISEDPIGFAGGQNSFYAYVNSDPLDRIDPYGLAWQFVVGVGATTIVPFFGGGLNFNVGLNLDWGNSSIYIQDQANLADPIAGGAYFGAGLNLQLSHADAPTTDFDSAKYMEGDVAWGPGLGANATENHCGGLDYGGVYGIKPGVGVGGGGVFSGTTYTATAVSPSFNSLVQFFSNL